ncbi:MAG: patatin-like phospholipase family protein [Caulobacterales bacterium]
MSAAPKPISLALQGGGAHGAFQWGVIDALLEDGRVEIRAVTGASSGAMNAVALAAGLIEGGAKGGREKLEAFWRAVNASGGQNPFGDSGVWTAMVSPDWLKATLGWRMAQTWATSQSPYDFNPFNLNPLRSALESQVNFETLRQKSPIALYVSATAVRTSKSRVFRTNELTCDHLLASACLPYLFQAVVIEGEPYWDGGFLANPALWPLFYDDTPNDLLIVNLNPFVRKETPKTPGQILDRMNEISFNASLAAELRAVAFVQKLIGDGMLKEEARGRYRNILIHAIGADRWLQDLDLDSKFNTEWSFLEKLKDRGRRAAAAWLEKGLADVGVRSSADFRAEYM